jgi:hypothetical protein
MLTRGDATLPNAEEAEREDSVLTRVDEDRLELGFHDIRALDV